MKPSFVCICMIAAVYANAQNTSPYWSINGNNNTTLSHKIGTTNNVSVRFVTSNIERMKILGTGNIGIGISSPHASAAVDITSTTKGLLVPRMTTTQRNAIASPATGLLIYQTDGTAGFYYYNAGWKAVSSAGGGSGANTTLSNLASPTAVNVDLLPATTNARQLGTAGLAWQNLHLRGDVFLDGTRFLSNAPGTAAFNAFFGSHSGISITTGASNTAGGQNALNKTTSGSRNTAFGHNALYTNTTGTSNTALGYYTLYLNQTGGYNVGVGYEALLNNTTGLYNVGIGYQSIYNNTINTNNTAIGLYSGYYSSSSGTFLGAYAYSNIGVVNSTAIGYGAFAGSSNQVRVGNGAVSSIGGQVGWTTFSDGRFKKDVNANVPGLEFINQLKPVTYSLEIKNLEAAKRASLPSANKAVFPAMDAQAIAEQSKVIYSGFIAQEVHETAKKMNFPFSGVDVPLSDQDFYGIRYSDFVVPLVRAVQELDSANKVKEERIAMLEEKLNEVLLLLGNSGLTTSSPWVKQNTPNPVYTSTTISYYVPGEVRSARILITNAKGQQLKVYNVTGSGTISFSAGTLPSGTYTYTLVADGRTIQSKKMVIAR